MAYYYNGAEISTPFTIVSNEPMFDMTTISLKTERASQGHQRWELNFNTVLSTSDAQIDNFIESFKDLSSSSTMVMPQFKHINDNFTASSNSIAVGQSAASGATTVYLNRGSDTGLIPKGSFIKFNNHDKVYVVTNNVDLTGTGNIAVNIYPNLKQAVTTANTFKLDSNCLFSYYRNIDNQTGITFSDGILANTGTITLIEAI